MQAIKWIIMILAAVAIQSHANVLLGKEGGGANHFEQMVKMAQLHLRNAMNLKELKNASEATRKFVNQNRGQLLMEINGLNPQYDHLSDEPFVHANGSNTWLATDGYPLAPIRLRSRVAQNMSVKLNMATMVSFLGHEVGHHFFQDDESKAWEVATVFTELYNSLVLTFPIPQLADFSSGHYVALDAIGGCFNAAHFTIDPYAAKIHVVATSSPGSACYDHDLLRKDIKEYEFVQPLEQLVTHSASLPCRLNQMSGREVECAQTDGHTRLIVTSDGVIQARFSTKALIKEVRKDKDGKLTLGSLDIKYSQKFERTFLPK